MEHESKEEEGVVIHLWKPTAVAGPACWCSGGLPPLLLGGCVRGAPYEKLFFGYPKNIPGPPQIINYPDRGPELGGPILRKFTLGWAGPTRRLGLWKNSGPETGPEVPKMTKS